MRSLVLALFGWLILSAPALAAVRCLEGEFSLSDQRDLASFRGLAEEECPCSDYTGEPGLHYAAYQRCVKPLLRQAIDRGDLRRECRGTANRINHSAVCGLEDEKPCGYYRLGGRTSRAKCIRRAPDRCVDRGTLARNACEEFTHCTDVVEHTAGTCVDSRAIGPYGVGFDALPFVKSSALDPNEPRVLNTWIWYPAAPGAIPHDFLLGDPGVPLASNGGRFPLIVFSHGRCSHPQLFRILLSYLASHGFIVATPAHPGSTAFDPGCNTNPFTLEERPRDIEFVITAMINRALDPTSRFHGKLDDAKVGVAGHSLGGWTTYWAAFLDERVSVAMPFAPSAVGPLPPLSVPSLTMLAGVDNLENNDNIRDTYEAGSEPRYLVELNHSVHSGGWSDFCPNCSSLASPDPVVMTRPEAQDAARRWIVPFLKVHLEGDQSFKPFLAGGGEGPGVVFKRSPR